MLQGILCDIQLKKGEKVNMVSHCHLWFTGVTYKTLQDPRYHLSKSLFTLALICKQKRV